MGPVVGGLALLGVIAAIVVWLKRKSKSGGSEPNKDDFSSAVVGYPQATDPASIELQVAPKAQFVPSPAPAPTPVRPTSS